MVTRFRGAAALAALLTAGCGPVAGHPVAVAVPSTPVSPSTPPGSTTQVPTTSTTRPRPMVARDGRNLERCADGVCEVFVRTGDVLRVDGLGSVFITVRGGTIEIDAETPSVSLSASGYPGDVEQLNAQKFLVVAVQGNRGVLRLSH